MKNILFLSFLCLVAGCTKKTNTAEETLIPTATEKKIIDVATSFFKSGGGYYQIAANYSVALRPVLEVRKTLTQGACTANVFQTQCCCPWEFLLSPYDAVNGNITSFNYPKSAVFTARPGKMEGSISAAFANRPVSSDITEVRYHNLAFIGIATNLDGIVSIKDVVIPPYPENLLYTAEFSDNTFTTAFGQITSISGHLSFTNGDASGKLDITYADDKKITAEITLTDMPANFYAGFVKKVLFTVDGITSELECFDKQTITIGTRTFKLNL